MKKKTPMATLKQFLHNNGYFVRQEITDRINELLKEDNDIRSNGNGCFCDSRNSVHKENTV